MIRKKIISLFLLIALCFSVACENRQAKKTDGNNTYMPVEEVEYDFPDTLPKKPYRVDSSYYAYDDLTKHHSFEIMLTGHINQPIVGDKIKSYLQKKFNATIEFTNFPGDQLENNVAVRFSAGNPSDIIVVPVVNTQLAINLSKQNQTLDASKLLKYTPQAAMYITKAYKQWATVEGKMIGIPRYSTFADNWWLYIRKDWLENLNMKMPQTEEELFQYAMAVTKNDPNKSSKQDTWFMGSASGGSGFGMLEALKAMFGHSSVNVVDGRINHPMLDGTTKSYIAFVKRLYENGLLTKDWYTAPWNQFKGAIQRNQIGLVHYPGWNLIDEYYQANGQDEKSVQVWEPLGLLKSNDGRGGKLPFGGAPGGTFVFSNKAGESEGKLRRIAHFIDSLIYPNENYWAASQGGGVEIFPDAGTTQIFNENDGTNIFTIDQLKHPAYIQQQYSALADWQWIGYTLIYQVYDNNDIVGREANRVNSIINSLPRYENFDLFVNFDPKIQHRLQSLQTKEELAFVLGRRDFGEWDKYVNEWMSAGGKQMLNTLAEQLGVEKIK